MPSTQLPQSIILSPLSNRHLIRMSDRAQSPHSIQSRRLLPERKVLLEQIRLEMRYRSGIFKKIV